MKKEKVGCYGLAGLLFLALNCAAFGVWNQQAKLTAGDGMYHDMFGTRVSISGEWAIAGAHQDDNSQGTDAGAAYVYRRTGSTWAQAQKIIAPDGTGGDWFGFPVKMRGDYAIIGAPRDDGDRGSAYIYQRSGATWNLMGKVVAGDRAAGDNFGYAASIHGDYAIVGAYYDDNSGKTNVGSAYIFHNDNGTWVQQSQLIPADGSSSDLFGIDVAIWGDYAVVGSYCDDDKGQDSGSVYVYHRNGTQWDFQTKITAPDGQAFDYFGEFLCICGNRMIIGAYGDDDNGADAGSAYIYRLVGTDWVLENKITASDGVAGDNFGNTVAISGNYAIIGAHGDDDLGDYAGAAYLFEWNGSAWRQIRKLTASDGGADHAFGVGADIDGSYAIVGGPEENHGPGAAYVFNAPPDPEKMQTVLYDNFDDGNYDGWTVTNPFGRLGSSDFLAPAVVSSPEGYSVRGTGQGYDPDWSNVITHPISIEDTSEICIEIRARSGSEWPNMTSVMLGAGLDAYGFDVYGEGNRSVDMEKSLNRTQVYWDRYYGFGSNVYDWHNYAWIRAANGDWFLFIDNILVPAANFRQDSELTTFEAVELMLHRDQSEIEWVRISVAPVVGTLVGRVKLVGCVAPDAQDTGVRIQLRQNGTAVQRNWAFLDEYGQFIVSTDGLQAGTYDVAVSVRGWLQTIIRDVPINVAPNSGTSIGTVDLLGGDSNGDNVVSFEDFSILQNNYGQSCETAANPLAAVAATSSGTGGCSPLGILLLTALGLGLHAIGLRKEG